MKKIFKIFGLLFLAGMTMNSCETTELDLTENPNSLTPDQADADFYLNAIQIRYADLMRKFGQSGAAVVRIEYMGNRNYLNAYGVTSFDDEWDDAYREILNDVKKMMTIAEENSQFKHIAIAQTLSADVLVTLVDFFGDVPYSEALLGEEGSYNPNTDAGGDIYAAAETMLNSAIANFNRTDDLAEPDLDLYYGNDYDKWVKLANTFKMKIYAQTRLVDNSATGKFNAIVTSGDFISSNEDDFQFQYGTNETQPDTRHPQYASNYTPTGAGSYLSNWLMGTMLEESDPRIRYYFYRQVSAVPGEGADPNEQDLTCSVESAPPHYVAGGYTFCNLPNGYWGRDHGDDDGVPGDGFLRSTYGVYPVGGSFDDSRFDGVAQGAGAGGAGIVPLMLASWVDFLRAEMAFAANSPEDAKEFMLDGMEKSVQKVTSFGALDPDADLSVAPSNERITDFYESIEASYDAGSTEDKWNILSEQFWVASFGNGILNYNYYRRTGYPTTLQPNREPDPGGFIRSFRYPANFVNNNSSVSQKQTVTNQVFWDTNPSSPGFPASN